MERHLGLFFRSYHHAEPVSESVSSKDEHKPDEPKNQTGKNNEPMIADNFHEDRSGVAKRTETSEDEGRNEESPRSTLTVRVVLRSRKMSQRCNFFETGFASGFCGGRDVFFCRTHYIGAPLCHSFLPCGRVSGGVV